jgi:hypothetical protein
MRPTGFDKGGPHTLVHSRAAFCLLLTSVLTALSDDEKKEKKGRKRRERKGKEGDEEPNEEEESQKQKSAMKEQKFESQYKKVTDLVDKKSESGAFCAKTSFLCCLLSLLPLLLPSFLCHYVESCIPH